MLKQFLFGFTLAAMTAGVIPASNAAEANLAPQVSNERSIKVTVTPKSISQEVQTWDFAVALETHIHPLDDDLAKSSVLIADGKQYVPSGWEGAPPGGHHRKGNLHFKPVTPQPSAVELQIRLSGDAAPRSFRWTLKGASYGK